MKLYTEEQVRKAIDLARVTLADKSPYPKYIILSEIKGIELPSDEEIRELSRNYATFPLGPIGETAFFEGAKCIKQQILNQNK